MKERVSKKELKNLFITGYADDQMKEAKAYLERGRRFAGVPGEELRDRWIQASKAHYRDPTNDKLETEYRDLGAEFGLRQTDPPWDDVREDLEAYVAMAKKVLEVLRDRIAENSEIAEEWGEDLMKRLMEFRAPRKRSN